jgi:hypothetical protein
LSLPKTVVVQYRGVRQIRTFSPKIHSNAKISFLMAE